MTAEKVSTLRAHLNTARYDYLVGAAVRTAKRVGFHALTRDAIAIEAGVSPPLVSHHLGDMDAVRKLVMERAVRDGLLPLIAQGLTAQHPAALEAPAELRAAAAGSIA